MSKVATKERDDHVGKTVSAITKEHISTFIVRMFSEQPKKRLSDEALAFLLHEHFPKRSTEKNYLRFIPIYRNRFNRGDFAAQAAPPGDPILKYEDGKPVTRKYGPKPRLPGEKPVRRGMFK